MSLATTLDREAIFASAASLPDAPQIMARLYRLLLDCNSGLRAITELLKRDPALTLRIVRIANSPAYGAGGVGNIEEALTRVGFGEVYRLVGTASNDSLGRDGLRCYGFSADAYQRHNLYSALVAERLALATGLDPRAAYTAGLLRRIGQLLLDVIGRKSLAPSAHFPESGSGRAVDWERAQFGVSHYEVAGALLTEWGFPEEIVAAVEHGHGDGGPMSPLGRVIDLTDNIVRIAGFGLCSDESEWGIPGEKLAAVGIDHNTARRVQADALALLQAIQQSQKAAA